MSYLRRTILWGFSKSPFHSG